MKRMKKKVLCVERNNSLAFVLRTVLKNSFNTKVVSNALQAIDELHSDTHTDCIVLSVEKQNFRNIALLQHLKTSSFLKDIPVIVLADFYDKELETLCEEYNVTEVFEKPFDPLKLLEAVEEQCCPSLDSHIIFKKRKILNLN